MLQTVMMGLAAVREPRLVRERFEEELCALVRATSVRFPHDADDTNHPNVVSFELPGSPIEGRHRLEAVFDPARLADDWSRQMLAAGAHVAGLLLEIERANGRWPLGCARTRSDGAAPLIGSSRAIRMVRDRMERVAATDFTALIEGGIGPQPHRGFIEVFCEAAVDDGDGAVAGAGEDVLLSPFVGPLARPKWDTSREAEGSGALRSQTERACGRNRRAHNTVEC
jgi:hypothetical protein